MVLTRFDMLPNRSISKPIRTQVSSGALTELGLLTGKEIGRRDREKRSKQEIAASPGLLRATARAASNVPGPPPATFPLAFGASSSTQPAPQSWNPIMRD